MNTMTLFPSFGLLTKVVVWKGANRAAVVGTLFQVDMAAASAPLTSLSGVTTTRPVLFLRPGTEF